jgi:Trypsin
MGFWARESVLAIALLAATGCTQGQPESAELTTAIIGGQATLPGEFPATGALVYKGTFRCTATLIAPDVILTAAHCLEGSSGNFGFTLDSQVPLTPGATTLPPAVDPDAGTMDSSGDVDAGDMELPVVGDTPVYPVFLVHQHPDFDSGGANKDLGQVNDVGVAILRRPITTVPVEQVDTRLTDVGPGSELRLTGYGVTAWYLKYSAGIKHDAMVLVDGVGDFEIRTSAAAVEAQPCKGDSGGPLFAQDGDAHPITGVISRSATQSFQCNQGAIATRVAPYAGWIAEASLDRDTGCSVGGADRRTWAALLVWLLVAFRRRPARPSK